MLPVVSLPVHADEPVDISRVEGAEIVNAGSEKRAAQLETALAAQSRGYVDRPSDYEVVVVDETTVTLPKGATLFDVVTEEGHTSVDWLPDLEANEFGTLSDASAIDITQHTGMLQRDGSCSRVENSTGWMDTCFYRYRSKNTISWAGKRQYMSVLAVESTHKSKGAYLMHKARIRANPRQNVAQVKRSPSADANHGNCKSGSIGITAGGLGVSANVEKCDKWDVGWSKNGQMDNTWFGRAYRSERNVAMMIAVARTSKADATWSLKSDFWTYFL